MKKSIFAGVAAVLSTMLALMTFSCVSLDGLVQTPTVSMDSVSIAGVDLEGISFNANYSVKNIQHCYTATGKERSKNKTCTGKNGRNY